MICFVLQVRVSFYQRNVLNSFLYNYSKFCRYLCGDQTRAAIALLSTQHNEKPILYKLCSDHFTNLGVKMHV